MAGAASLPSRCSQQGRQIGESGNIAFDFRIETQIVPALKLADDQSEPAVGFPCAHVEQFEVLFNGKAGACASGVRGRAPANSRDFGRRCRRVGAEKTQTRPEASSIAPRCSRSCRRALGPPGLLVKSASARTLCVLSPRMQCRRQSPVGPIRLRGISRSCRCASPASIRK